MTILFCQRSEPRVEERSRNTRHFAIAIYENSAIPNFISFTERSNVIRLSLKSDRN